MPTIEPELLPKIIRLLLRPLARFCLAHALKIQDVVEGFKTEILIAAKDQLQKEKHKATDSKLSILTGLRRREITRLEQHAKATDVSRNLITKVIGLWQQDKKFCSKQGEPKVLSIESSNNEFAKLVSKVSKELAPGTILFEMERLGVVTRTEDGVKLEVSNFIPAGDAVKGFQFISQHLDDLLQGSSFNILESPQVPHHHLITEYDRIRPAELAELRNWFLREGHALHLRVRERLGTCDQDVNPDTKFSGKGTRVVFGSFSYIEEPRSENEET